MGKFSQFINFYSGYSETIERFHDTSWHMEPNKHECFEMVYIKRGKAVFEIAGYPAEIGPNDIIIIKPISP